MESKFIKQLPVFYAYAAFMLLIGLAGTCMGLYVIYYRGATPGELMLNKSLTWYSIGFVSSAGLHFKAFNVIRKMKSEIDKS